MFDSVSSRKVTPALAATTPFDAALPAKPACFADVLSAVEAATDVSPKVRDNMRSAVNKIANLVSTQGLSGPVVIADIDKMLAHQTAAMLGMKTANALAGMKSNFRRALRLAGFDVMPGRHVTPLTPAWQRLMASFSGDRMAIKLSRFAHVASEHGWEPQDIGPGHLHQFRVLLSSTNIGSKTDRVLRDMAATWSFGVKSLPGWPKADLGRPPGRERFYIRPWSDFPASFREDVEAFITRKGASFNDDLEKIEAEEDEFLHEDQERRHREPLRERTKRNYRDGFRRIASILVKLGRPTATICGLADLVALSDVTKVLRFMRDRTQKQDGGHISYLAFLLYFAARDHVKLPWKQVDDLERLWSRVRGEHGKMSPRSFKRLLQFDDPDRNARMANLPNMLAAAARERKVVDTQTIRLMRTAVFTAIGLDTGMRNGNIVRLTLDRHVTLHQSKKKWFGEICVPGSEVKNGRDIVSKIQPETAALICEWIDKYRPAVLAKKGVTSNYLFPNEAGSHLSVTVATESMKDLGAKIGGLDITPHVMRSYLGKIILDESPDAYPHVQELLGHRNLETTLKSYAPVRDVQVRQRSQKLLADLRAERR